MVTSDSTEVSRLLLAYTNGDESAFADLVPLVYEELRVLARRHLRNERTGHTLQTTALIHEAYLRLVGADVRWEGKVHFFAVSAQIMRRILVDHARRRGRAKRGGSDIPSSLEELPVAAPETPADLEALDEALERLTSFDPRKARVVELHYFGGLTYDEVAQALHISAATVDRDLRLAKAWLHRELRPQEGDQ
jgi:RNA polymerase sigma factor (TIGR02999 family)